MNPYKDNSNIILKYYQEDFGVNRSNFIKLALKEFNRQTKYTDLEEFLIKSVNTKTDYTIKDADKYSNLFERGAESPMPPEPEPGVSYDETYKDFNMLEQLAPENEAKIEQMLNHIHKKESSGGKASPDSLESSFKKEGAQGEYQQRPIFIKEVTKNMGFNNGKPYDPNDPVMARAAAKHFLVYMLNKGYTEKEALRAYNAGEYGMRKGHGSKYTQGFKL